MKKILMSLVLSVLCLTSGYAKKVAIDLSTDQKNGNASWVADTKTLSWTGTTDKDYLLLTGVSGDLTNNVLSVDISEVTAKVASKAVQYCFYVYYTDANGSETKKASSVWNDEGVKTLSFSTLLGDDAAKVTKVTLTGRYGNAGSLKVSDAYLTAPLTALDFGKTGIAELDFSDLTASGVTFDESTGVVTSTGTGTLALSLPTSGIDMTNVNRIVVEYEGDDIFNNLLVSDVNNGKLTQAFSSKYNLLFTSYQDKAQNVNKMIWEIKTEGTMTIKAIKFYGKQFAEKYTLTISDAGASTLVLPYTVKIPENVTAYTLAYSSGDQVKATQLTGTIPANTPVLVNAPAGDYDFERASGTDVPNSGNKLQTKDALNGQYWSKFYAPKGSYVLQSHAGKVGFYRVATADSQEVPPFRAFLLAEAAGAKASLDIDFTGTTGIHAVDFQNKLAQGRRYNLMGVEVSNDYEGIVIVNGKKVLVK